MTVPWEVAQNGDPTYAPLEVIVTEVKPGAIPRETPSQVTGYGFTISRAVGTDFTAVQLVGEDPLRTAIYVLASAVIYIGDQRSMQNAGQLTTTLSNGPGMRIPAAATSPFRITAQSAIWVGFTGAVEVGVWVERRVPGGAI